MTPAEILQRWVRKRGRFLERRLADGSWIPVDEVELPNLRLDEIRVSPFATAAASLAASGKTTYTQRGNEVKHRRGAKEGRVIEVERAIRALLASGMTLDQIDAWSSTAKEAAFAPARHETIKKAINRVRGHAH